METSNTELLRAPRSMSGVRRSIPSSPRRLTPRSFRRPRQPVDKHLSRFQIFVPGVIHDVVLAVRAGDDGIMSGADKLVGNGAQNARAGFVAFVRIRSEHEFR